MKECRKQVREETTHKTDDEMRKREGKEPVNQPIRMEERQVARAHQGQNKVMHNRKNLRILRP